eukprot:CCRYP_004238-RA/>CCRYP_004238-RA protein AED:0.00 eAED:0.00 QI:57/1/0.5/1/0/0/2/0/63
MICEMILRHFVSSLTTLFEPIFSAINYYSMLLRLKIDAICHNIVFFEAGYLCMRSNQNDSCGT